jgi:hypothetical protein
MLTIFAHEMLVNKKNIAINISIRMLRLINLSSHGFWFCQKINHRAHRENKNINKLEQISAPPPL